MFQLKSRVYIQFYENRIKVSRLDTQESVEEKSEEAFSSSRLIIGDFEIAETCLRTMIKKLWNSRWGLPQLFALVQVMEKCEGGLSNVEKRVIKEVVERCGAKKVKIYEGKYPLSLSDALKLLQ